MDNNGELWAGSDRAPTAGTDFVQYYAPGVDFQFIDRDGAKVKGSGTSYGIFPCLSFSPGQALPILKSAKVLSLSSSRAP